MTSLSSLTVDELADGICLRAGRIAAAQAELLSWIAEFDRREGWAGPGLLSCAHWLSWRIGLSPGTAREQVRVARSLEDLPEIAAAFAGGRLSYSQARAITRVARRDDGIDWTDLARGASAGQLERLVRGLRRVASIEEAAADPEEADWKVRTRRRYDSDGNLVITIITRPQYGPVIEAALAAKKAELDRHRDVAGGEPVSAETSAGADAGVACGEPVSAETPADAAPKIPAAATDGDALLALAQDALAAEQKARPDLARRRRPHLTPLVDPLSGWARQHDGELLPPASLSAVLTSVTGRDGVVRLRPFTAADLRRHDLGRSQRVVSTPLRELLGVIDGERCRFPGCTRHRKLHGHHVVYWRDGGRTDLGNLVLLCARHHTLVHSLEFGLTLHADRRLEVRTADGVPVLHHPAQPWGDPAAIDPQRRVTADTLPPVFYDGRFDLGYAVSVLLSQAS